MLFLLKIFNHIIHVLWMEMTWKIGNFNKFSRILQISQRHIYGFEQCNVKADLATINDNDYGQFISYAEQYSREYHFITQIKYQIFAGAYAKKLVVNAKFSKEERKKESVFSGSLKGWTRSPHFLNQKSQALIQPQLAVKLAQILALLRI